MDDGGYLLRTVKWPTLASYQEIYDVYRAFVIKNFGTSATIVFDGYDCYLSTKSAEQMRRSKKNTSANIEISSNLPVTVKQSEFLGNAHNKKQLIFALSNILQREGIQVKHAKADADSFIISTSIETAMKNAGGSVVVVGTDTDLLVMLVGHATPELDL